MPNTNQIGFMYSLKTQANAIPYIYIYMIILSYEIHALQKNAPVYNLTINI